ncbi:unnamed protein product, partial [Mesorhabditis belari]|uniref:Uncharacterized protein n=1 Tax=Mesorhabditis belari TaxID=2138241 RepID=A0AAF3EJC9_9BILA
MPSTTIHSIKEALSTKIITLKSQFIETRLNELNNELRAYLLMTSFDNVPEEDQIKVHIKKMLESFKKECFENAIESAEFCIIEGKVQTTLEKTGLICRSMLASKKIAEMKKAELEAELAAEKHDSANYSDISSDSENDLEEEYETCKTQSNGSLNVLDSASLPINFPRPDSPEYEEISDTEIDRYVSKPLEEDAFREKDIKFRPTKKRICAQRVGDVFNELLAGEFHNVLECDSMSIAKISALIEYSKSQRDFFSRTLCKARRQMDFFLLLYAIQRDLPLNVPPGTHITLLCDIKEWFIEMKNKREREEWERRENEEKQRQAEILRRLEDGNNSRKIFSFPKLPNLICNSGRN